MSHARRPRPLAPALLIALASLAAPSTSRADESENYGRLQAMPRERRVALAENLERFDKLDSTDRAAIRKLDDQIARKDPTEQAKYRALLRRYHLWLSGLSDEQKQALKSAETPEARFALARKFRIKEAEAGAPIPKIAGIRTGDYGLIGPYEAAHLLRIWNKLPPDQRAKILKEQERGRLFAAIRETKPPGVRFEGFPEADRTAYIARLEGDPAFKKALDLAGRPALKKNDAAQKKAEAVPKKGETPLERVERPYAEFLYFEEHKPPAVSPKNFERFSASCPPWIHAMTDPLSADDAREYLTILYRLLYPHPTEMPVDSKPAPKPPAPAAPASKKGTNPGPI